MDMKVKTLLIISLSTLVVASCSSTNGRYSVGQQAVTETDKEGVTHTHNGVAHTHLLPEGGLSHSHNYNSGTAANTCAPCTGGATRNVVTAPVTNTSPQTNVNTGNSHAHNGRRHSHPLPASGTNHTHNQGQAPQQNTGATYYDYSAGSTASGSNYYNYGGAKGNANANSKSHSHGEKSHAHALPASGLNHTHNQGSTSIGNSYGSGNTGGASNGNTYTVRPKDTVFQVMRNTGVYWKTIIKLNNLQAPDYTIQPGQTLKLR